MQTLKIGQQVTLAFMEPRVFRITAVNIDGSYTIETQLDNLHSGQQNNQQKLSYDSVSPEMLKVLAPKL
ncbi:hypothetical protein [Acinetobacter sp.]|uniref:hypothetical protein n=1 Tax=Acinetobacter sp. TaxID=472 RepID=UPI0035ADBBF7